MVLAVTPHRGVAKPRFKALGEPRRGLCGQHNRPHRKGVDGPSGSCVDHTETLTPSMLITLRVINIPVAIPNFYKKIKPIQGFGPRHG